MTNDDIKELIQIFDESGVAEMEVQRGENRLRLRRAPTAQELVMPVAAHAPAHAPAPAAAPAAPASAGSSAKPSATHPTHTIVKSPIVGTYYDAPSPGAATFVKIGDTVEPRQGLFIIEAMKLMNEITAEIPGDTGHKP